MAVTLFATDADGENYVSNVTTMSFTVPGGVLPDDIIEFAVTTTSSTATTLTPSHSTGAIMASYTSGDAALQAQSWYYRVPAGGAPATISVTLAAARQGSLVWRIWRGVDTTTALDVAPAIFSNATPQASITIQSITTVTPGAYICGHVHNGSGGDGPVMAGGWTIDVDATRRNGVFIQKGVQASAGATGAQAFAWSSGTYTGRIVTVAWRPAASGPATPTLTYNLTRPATPDSFYVSTKTANATSVRVKAATNAALTTGVVFGSAGTPDADGYARSTVTGLAANTQYHYGIEMTDSASGLTTTAKVGAAHTLPTAGVPCASWVIGFGSCHDLGVHGGTSTAYTNLFAHNPQMVWSLGDTPYADSLSTSQAVHRGFMEAQLDGVSGWKSMNANYCLQYTKSDHDSSDNDSKTGAWTAPNRAATLQMFPQDGRPASDGLYRSEVVGRVRIIYIDTRYYCTPSTKLGTTQMAWLKTELLQPEPVKILVQDGVWIDNRTPDPVDDTWQFYNTERLEIANAPRVGRLYGASGDQHSISADNGSHNAWGGWPTVCAAPFRNNASHKTASGPADWSNGEWPTTEGAVVNQHGVLTLLDDGTAITLQFRGYDDANVARVSMDTVFVVDDEADAVGITDSVSATSTFPRTIGDNAGITDSLTAAQSFARTQGDAVGITDSLTALISTERTVGDNVGITDAATATVSRDRTQPDAVGITDSATAAAERPRAVGDAVGLTDSVTASLSGTGEANPADAVSITDAITAAASRSRSTDDPVGITDSLALILSAQRAPGDAIGISDNVSVSLSGQGEVVEDDVVGITDQASRTVSAQRTAGDPVGITDEVTVALTRVVTVADFLALTDTVASTSGATNAEADNVGISDTVTVLRSTDRPLSDPVGITDAVTLQRNVGLAVLDPVGVTDSLLVQWDGYTPTPLPDVLTVTLVPLEMATVTLLDEQGRPIVGCIAEMIEKRGDTRTRTVILNRSLVGLAPSDIRVLISARGALVETLTPTIVDAAGGVISFQFTGALAKGLYVVEFEVTTPSEISTHPTDGYVQLRIEPDLGP